MAEDAELWLTRRVKQAPAGMWRIIDRATKCCIGGMTSAGHGRAFWRFRMCGGRAIAKQSQASEARDPSPGAAGTAMHASQRSRQDLTGKTEVPRKKPRSRGALDAIKQ
jgi:hypothetical protein